MGRTKRPACSCVNIMPALLVSLLLALSGTIWPQTAAAGKPWQVVSSDAAQVRFSVEGLQADWQARAVRGGTLTFYTADIPGFLNSAIPGQPQVPVVGTWLIVPPGTRPELRTIGEKWQDAGRRPLLPAGVPVMIGDPRDPQNVRVAKELILPGEPLPDPERVPADAMQTLIQGPQARSGSAATLGQVAVWRGRRIVPVQLAAVQHDAEGLATRVLNSGTWEVRFVPDAQAEKRQASAGGRKLTGKNDDRFPGLFLNGEQLRSLPTEAAFRGGLPVESARSLDKILDQRGQKAGTLLGPETKITVSVTRLLRVTYARLRAEGLLPDSPIQENQIRLYQRRYYADFDDGQGAPWLEVEVPIHMVGEGDAFDGDDYFLFYGLRLREDGPYEDEIGGEIIEVPGAGDPFEMNNEFNIYWLAASEPDVGSPWARMATQTLPAVPAEAEIAASYRRQEHYESQLVYREYIPYNSTDVLYNTSAKTNRAAVPMGPMQAPDPGGSDPVLTASVALFAQPGIPLNFYLVRDNSSTLLLGSRTPSSTNAQELVFPLQAADIQADDLELVMTNANSPSSVVKTYINWVELSYDALFQVPSGQGNLLFTGGGGLPNLVVSGFDSSDLGAVETTDPRHPVIVNLAPENIVADGADWSLSIALDQAGGSREFYAAGGWHGTGIREFTYFEAETVLDPVDPTEVAGPDPDLVVVVHPEFRNALEPWLEHRRARSDGQLNIHVVEVQDVYDWYSGGLRDPWAIKRLANHALNEWGTWALVLVGDANENARQLGVINAGRAWSTDWVPTHLHVQSIGGYNPERLGSDKWYATSGAGGEYPDDYYPDQTLVPTDMYVGRFPCNSGSELSNIISKIIAMETVRPDQTWRRRGIFIADDEWSNSYVNPLADLEYDSDEIAFQRCNEDFIVPWWTSGGPVPLDSPQPPLYLKNFLDPYWSGTTTELRDLDLFRSYCEADAVPALKSALNRGGVVAHYQGHANWHVLAAETWFVDWNTGNLRQDMVSLNNFDGDGQPMPWVFFGMGCHISEYIKNTVYSETVPYEQSLGEKFLVRSRAGACATYGSSGYEFIDSNEYLGTAFFRRMVLDPPTTAVNGSGSTSRWVLGELLWATEGDVLAVYTTSMYREMCAQFVLLGDPLMVLDAGPAQVTARLTDAGDQLIEGTVELPALDVSNLRTLSLEAKDEAGVDRIRIIRTREGLQDDLTSLAATGSRPIGASNDQIMNYALEIPIIPCPQEVSVGVYDAAGALDSDLHYTLTLQMPVTWEFTMDGKPWVDGDYTFPLGELVSVSGVVTLPTYLVEGWQFDLTGDNLEVTDLVLAAAGGRQLSVAFTGRAPGGTEGSRGVKLTIENYETPIELETVGEEPPFQGISKVYNFPNPMHEETRFLFQSGFSATSGVIRVFSMAGRPVAQIPFRIGEAGPVVIPWDGRDPEGDNLANGVYLYRIELDTPTERTVSNMQRLVMMR